MVGGEEEKEVVGGMGPMFFVERLFAAGKNGEDVDFLHYWRAHHVFPCLQARWQSMAFPENKTPTVVSWAYM